MLTFDLKLYIEFDNPIEACDMYGKLLALDYNSSTNYAITDTSLEIVDAYPEDDTEPPFNYIVRVDVENIPVEKAQRLLDLLVSPDKEEKK